jgi:glutamate-ammonia-ligase adenylyltransferase
MENTHQHFPQEHQSLAENILGWSKYLSTQLQKHPEWIEHVLQSDKALVSLQERVLSCLPIENETEFLQALRTIRNREMCRIAWRDLSGWAELTETFSNTSDLAGYLLDASLEWNRRNLEKLHGIPRDADGNEQRLAIIGMGKLGGKELNFSSDIDLMFTFPEKGQTDGKRSLDNQTYFIRLGQKLNNSLAKITADGMVYRVDMRLRPFGQSGALALSFSAMENYYQQHGREWERYAMIKARAIAGDIEAGEHLINDLKPFFYRRYLDFGSIQHLREMKALIDQEAHKKGKINDLKLGQGGIREVEFIAQSFQLIRGGRMQELQHRNLLATLAAIRSQKLMPADTLDQLETAYCFLRKAENRVQMWDDQQTHVLPTDEHQQQMLAASMGYPDWDAFKAELDQHMDFVARQFDQVFARQEQATEDEAHDVWEDVDDHSSCLQHLASLNYQQPEQLFHTLHDLKTGRFYSSLTETARERLDLLMPLLLKSCSAMESPDLAIERALSVIEKIAGRSGYLTLLTTTENALNHFVKLVHASSWIATEIREHPILLDELLDTRQLYQMVSRENLQQRLSDQMQGVDCNDTETVMETLRNFKRTEVLRVAAIDVMKAIPLMKVSDQLTWIAEVILEKVQTLAWEFVEQKHGIPQCEVDGEIINTSFAIIAYGKLGGIELSYSSDLDVVFVHNNNGKKAYTRTEHDKQKQIDSTLFYAKLAQRIISLCTTLTYSGRLYEIDTRLRPNGASGLMVTSLDAFARYQQEKAWTWEHQALVRARGVTGTIELLEQFNHIRHHILAQPRNSIELQTKVREMREKMWKELDKSKSGFTNLKKSPGGITDIEFIVQYLILANAHAHPEITTYSDNIRLLEHCQQADILDAEQTTFLIETYKTLREYLHVLALQEQSSEVEDHYFEDERAGVKKRWQTLMQN